MFTDYLFVKYYASVLSLLSSVINPGSERQCPIPAVIPKEVVRLYGPWYISGFKMCVCLKTGKEFMQKKVMWG